MTNLIFKIKCQGWEVALWALGWLCQHEDLSWDPQHPHEAGSSVVYLQPRHWGQALVGEGAYCQPASLKGELWVQQKPHLKR